MVMAAARVAVLPQQIAEHPRPGKRVLQVQLVYPPHQGEVHRRAWLRSVVHRRARQLQQLRLAHDRQIVSTVDHRFALASPMRPSAPDKKSFSSANCPILACSVLRSRPCSRFSAAVANTSAARCSNSVFHLVIWFGLTSNRSASFTSVWSPFTAANATFALNAAEWLRRGPLILFSPFFNGSVLAPQKQALHPTTPPNSRVPSPHSA